MKNLFSILLTMTVSVFCFLSTISTNVILAQSPTVPSFEKVKTDFKANAGKGWTEYLRDGLKIPIAQHSKIEVIPATKEMGLYSITGTYSSDAAWRTGAGKSFKDMYYHNVAVHVPKEIFGVEYFFLYNVNYTRVNSNYDILDNWKYSYSNEIEEPIVKGIQLPDASKRKEILVEHFKKDFKKLFATGENQETPANKEYFSRWVKILDFYVTDKSTKATNIFEWKWKLGVKFEIRNNDKFDLNTVSFDINVKYDPKTQSYSTLDGIWLTRDSDRTERSFTPESFNIGNLYENGVDAIYQKYAERIAKKSDQSFYDQQIIEFDALIKTATIEFIPNIKSYFTDPSLFESLNSEMQSWKEYTAFRGAPFSITQDIKNWEVKEAVYNPVYEYNGQIIRPCGGIVKYELTFNYTLTDKQLKKVPNLGENNTTKYVDFTWEYQEDGTFKIKEVQNY